MESMEEYIWVLLQFCEYKNSCTLSEKAVEQLQEAILSILSDKKQNMERIKALEEENKSKQKAYDDCYCEYKQYKQFESIPIQKVKDKLEELIPKSQQTYEEFKKSNKFDTTLHSRGIYLDAQIILLKELLGGTTNE